MGERVFEIYCEREGPLYGYFYGYRSEDGETRISSSKTDVPELFPKILEDALKGVDPESVRFVNGGEAGDPLGKGELENLVGEYRRYFAGDGE